MTRSNSQRCGLALSALLVATPPVAEAQLRNDAAWDVLVPNQIVEDAVLWQGQLVGADPRGGLIFFDPATDRIEFFTTANGLTSNRVQTLFVDDEGRLWGGTEDAGIVRLNGDRSVRAVTGLQDQINVVAIDGAGSSVYYGSDAGAGRLVSNLPERTFTEATGLVSNRVQAVAAFGERVWFGTDAGISEFDVTRNTLVTLSDGLPSLNVQALHADVDGVWAGTSSGVVTLDESSPGARTWTPTAPALGNSIIDLDRSGGTLLALGVDNSLWMLAPGGGAWSRDAAPTDNFVFRACVFDGQGRAWGGGRRRNLGFLGFDPTPVFWSATRDPSPLARGLFGVQPRGVDLDGVGGLWIGSFPSFEGLTHWRADGSVVVYNRPDTGSGDGWLGGPKLAVHRTRAGALWVSGFSVGVTRMIPNDGDPASAQFLHLRPASSPLRADRVRAIAEDPAGHIWFGGSNEETDTGLNRGIDILLDPANPLDAGSWTKIDTDNSLLAGDGIWAFEFGPAGTVWIAIDGAGVQSWDYDGATGSGNPESGTLLDAGQWRSFSSVPTLAGDSVEKARDLALGPDGRIWVATTDLGVFGWIPSSFVAESDVVHVESSPVGVSLLSNQVRGIALDSAGAIWAGSQAGLHRIVEGESGVSVDAFTDFAAYLGFGLAERNYSTEILSPLPGGNVVAVVSDPTHDRMHFVTNSGAARVRLSLLNGAVQDGSFDFSIYPNPVRDDDAVFIDGFVGEARVEVFNLLGVRLRELDRVVSGDEIWDARTRNDDPVASGLYLVRLSQDGRSAIKTLAVER